MQNQRFITNKVYAVRLTLALTNCREKWYLSSYWSDDCPINSAPEFVKSLKYHQ